MGNSQISLGKFRAEIASMTAPRLVRNEPLEPLSISVHANSVNVVLGASPCISLCSGLTSVVLSHILEIKRSIKGGERSYKIICDDYTASDIPVPVEYRLFVGNRR